MSGPLHLITPHFVVKGSDDTDEFSFGRKLQRRRKQLGLTQKELGQRAGCAAETVRKIEADERRPSHQTAKRLAVALELTPSQQIVFVRVACGKECVDQFDPWGPVVPPNFNPPPTPPHGIVTFLFTGIEDSARLWERDPQAMLSTLSRYEEILYQNIVAYNGVVLKKFGDGICAAFACPLDALAAAVAAQLATQAEHWEETGLLRIRMALHTGVTVKGGGDYVGPPLNRVARLLAVGHGAQILLSDVLVELVRDWLPPQMHLGDLGVHHLKDLARPEHVYQLSASCMPTDFPPRLLLPEKVWQQRTLSDPPGEIGCGAIPGEIGCGGTARSRVLVSNNKTPLVRRAATELIAEFANGVWFVPTATNSTPEQVPLAITQTLGVYDDVYTASEMGISLLEVAATDKGAGVYQITHGFSFGLVRAAP